MLNYNCEGTFHFRVLPIPKDKYQSRFLFFNEETTFCFDSNDTSMRVFVRDILYQHVKISRQMYVLVLKERRLMKGSYLNLCESLMKQVFRLTD